MAKMKMYNVSRIKRMIYGGCFFRPQSSRVDSLRQIIREAHETPSSYYHKRIAVADRPAPFKYTYGIE